MKVVIDIPENVYQAIMDSHIFMTKPRSGKTLLSILISGVENGTPLPKGHGRLIDADVLDEVKEMVTTDTGDYKYAVLMDNIRLMPTIIEADKTESEE